MGKKVAVINTSFVSVDDHKRFFKELMPDVKMINIVDDSLLAEVLENGGLTKNVTRRICTYAREAEAMGVDLILNQCSSVGEAVDVARGMINIPFLKVDEPMAEEAVEIGGTIAVVATVESTLAPSVRLIEQVAARQGKSVNIKECLVEGAFDILYYQGDKETHNKMAVARIREEAKSADAIVLAQGSMIVLLPELQDLDVPVLTSPYSGDVRVRDVLYGK